MGTADTIIIAVMSEGRCCRSWPVAMTGVVVNQELKFIPLRQG